MDSNLILVFLCIFIVFGAGGTLFWRLRKNRVRNNDVVARIDTVQPIVQSHTDALLSPWTNGKCKTLSGACGKGTMTATRSCIRDGTGEGKRCSNTALTQQKDCYVQCPRPKDVVDWGHSNDYPGLPIGSPLKGWYDISGQGQPNDYCRWVGEKGKMFWACQSEKDPYVKTDPSHISFSGGPANRSIPYHPTLVNKMCPTQRLYLSASDPDLQKSIANGLFARCGSRCVYDHRNPKNGWWFDGMKWTRIENMITHPCGTKFKDEMTKAVKKYEKIYDVKNAWVAV